MYWVRIPLGAAALAAAASATVVQYEMTFEFSGATPPAGAAPWLTATFDDGDTPGSVDLLLETTNLSGSEFVFEWLFNLDPDLDATGLAFSAPIKTGAFTDPTISLGENAYKADGDGFFDIKLDFSNGGGAAARFNAGDSALYTITGYPGLTAGSFAFESVMGGGVGTFPTAAHVGGIGATGDESGWVSTPEPASLALLAAGGLVFGRRR